jgi:hypothetical protein
MTSLLVSTVVPIRTGTGLNSREHWAARGKRVAHERRTTRAFLSLADRPRLDGLPMICELTRIGPRLCDSDNLQGGLKAIRDEVAAWLGCSDGPRGPVEWRYSQERGPWGVRIQIAEVP